MKSRMRSNNILTRLASLKLRRSGRTALKNAALKLSTSGIDSAWLDAELILAFILKKPRAEILAHDNIELTQSQSKRFNSLIKQRLNLTPLAYILGYKEFYGLSFRVTKDTLVPRPESELLVGTALSLITKNTTLIDLGTGSGCLLISVLKNSKIKPKKSIAIDISSKTLSIARENAKKHTLNNIIFKKSNLFSNLRLAKNEQYLIMANLPYVSAKLMLEKSIQKEPRKALYGGKDGLDYYRKLKNQLPEACIVLCEINPDQKVAFNALFPRTVFKKDLSGRTRLAIVQK